MVTATKQGHDLAYLLNFKDVTVLENFMKYISVEIDRPDIVWESPEDYHVTLVYVPGLELADAVHLSVEAKMVEPIDVQFDGFGTFSTARGDKSNVLYMAVVPSHDLRALQSQIFDDVLANGGVVPSVFSDPEKWIPHITLAYADEPFNELAFPEVGGASIRGKRIEASVDFETIEVSVEKFNPHHLTQKLNPFHVPAGRPPGGQFDFKPSDSRSLQGATPKGQRGKQEALSVQIDGYTRTYGQLYRNFFREDDDKKAAVQQEQLRSLASVRDNLIAQRNAGKQLNVRLGIRTQLVSFVNAGQLDKARGLVTAVEKIGNIDLSGERILQEL